MANLASIIMEGATFGSGYSGKLSHSYDHENGAAMIAMESAEALRDIFETTFYVPNTCEIAAALEGASCVEESSQMVIMEGAFKNAFAKIKDFFIKLKDKVIEFLHSIKRYLDGIFKNDEDWVKKYKEDLKGLKSSDLAGYEVKMYKYTNLEHDTGIQERLSYHLGKTINDLNGYIYRNDDTTKETEDDAFDEEMNKMYEAFIKDNKIDADPEDSGDIAEKIFGHFRDDATGESDKDDVSVASNIGTFITALEKSTKESSAYDKEINASKQGYEKVIKYIDGLEKKVDKLNISDGKTAKVKTSSVDRVNDENGNHTGNFTRGNKDNEYEIKTTQAQSKITGYLRALSSTTSKMQSFANDLLTAKKTAYVERNAAYKKALMGAFAYARKNKKK